MRIHVDLKSHVDGTPSIIQVEKSPAFGEDGQVAINGKYVIPAPPGVDFPLDENSYVLPINGLDVVSRSFGGLLAAFPQYETIYFNPLLTEDHVDELDFSGTFVDRSIVPPVTFQARFQTGREVGSPLDQGQMPTHTAILPVNAAVSPNRPGILITDLIDIGPYTLDGFGNPVGTDDFMVCWKLVGFDVSDDISAEYGAQADKNEPAIRYLQEVDQEPSGFSAYISVDGGANFCPVGLLEPVGFAVKSTSIMLAFRNDTAENIYLANYALLF